jgi:hypothetical protein
MSSTLSVTTMALLHGPAKSHIYDSLDLACVHHAIFHVRGNSTIRSIFLAVIEPLPVNTGFNVAITVERARPVEALKAAKSWLVQKKACEGDPSSSHVRSSEASRPRMHATSPRARIRTNRDTAVRLSVYSCTSGHFVFNGFPEKCPGRVPIRRGVQAGSQRSPVTESCPVRSALTYRT